MEIKLIKSTEGVWYAPDIDDNREKPESLQMRALIVPMSGHEMQRLEEQGIKFTRGKLNIGARINRVRQAILTRCVQKIVNLKIENEQIETGAALVSYSGYGPVDMLILDIFEAIKDHSILEEGLSKKFGSPSVS